MLYPCPLSHQHSSNLQVCAVYIVIGSAWKLRSGSTPQLLQRFSLLWSPFRHQSRPSSQRACTPCTHHRPGSRDHPLAFSSTPREARAASRMREDAQVDASRSLVGLPSLGILFDDSFAATQSRPRVHLINCTQQAFSNWNWDGRYLILASTLSAGNLQLHRHIL